jgi:hypothetical protein
MTAGRLALCLVVLLGCDAQVDPSYTGEAMATIRGTTAGFGLDEVADSAAILWNANRGADVPSGPIAPAILHAHLPASLSLIVLSPPPAEAFFAVDGETARVAEGYLHLLRPGAGAAPTIVDFVGVALDVALVYIEGTVEPDGLTAKYLGGVLTPGYHLVRWRATAELSEAQAYFAARCAAESAAGDCGLRRRYQLSPSPGDLETPVTFVGRNGR